MRSDLWSEAEAAAAVRLRLAGLPLKAVSRRVGRSGSEVANKIRRAGLSRPRGTRRLRERIRRWAARGEAKAEIALLLGVSRFTVYYHLRGWKS